MFQQIWNTYLSIQICWNIIRCLTIRYHLQFLIRTYISIRYYEFIGEHGVLKKGREVMLTGCFLRTAMGGPGHARILPTEYMVILLDEVSLQFQFKHIINLQIFFLSKSPLSLLVAFSVTRMPQ
jgi:hypothetical protein